MLYVYRKTGSTLWQPRFSTNLYNLNNLGRESDTKGPFVPNHFQIVAFDKKIFLLLSLHICKIGPIPGGHVFQWINIIWTIFVEDHPTTICVKLFLKGPSSF